MTAPEAHPQRLRVAHLNPRQPTVFLLRPDAGIRSAIATELDLIDLPKLEFKGEIRAEGGDAWELKGRLTARVVQPCVVTLKPVKTNLDEQVRRLYTPHISEPDGDEVEIEDDTIEPLGQFIDLSALMVEELLLALPQYPRAEGSEMEPEATDDVPVADTRRPFAGLDKLLKGEGDSS